MVRFFFEEQTHCLKIILECVLVMKVLKNVTEIKSYIARLIVRL